MIEKIETALMFQFNSKYININSKYFRLRCNAVCNLQWNIFLTYWNVFYTKRHCKV